MAEKKKIPHINYLGEWFHALEYHKVHFPDMGDGAVGEGFWYPNHLGNIKYYFLLAIQKHMSILETLRSTVVKEFNFV